MGEIEYSFSVEVAKEYGVNEAILIKNFQFWILKNKANGKNFIDGHYWTYNSQKALETLFPFWSVQNIKTTLKHLEEKGVIIKDRHNKVGFDKTSWYAFKDEGKWLSPCFSPLVKINQSISENQPIDELKLTNQYQIINKDNKQDNILPLGFEDGLVQKTEQGTVGVSQETATEAQTLDKKKVKRWAPPTLAEVEAYCKERNSCVDAKYFYDYFTAGDWYDAKGDKVKSWKQKLISWEGRNNKKEEKQQTRALSLVMED